MACTSVNTSLTTKINRGFVCSYLTAFYPFPFTISLLISYNIYRASTELIFKKIAGSWCCLYLMEFINKNGAIKQLGYFFICFRDSFYISHGVLKTAEAHVACFRSRFSFVCYTPFRWCTIWHNQEAVSSIFYITLTTFFHYLS